MQRFTRVLCTTLLLALFPLGAFADELVSLKVGYLTLSPEGSFASREPGFNTEIDVEDDLEMDDSEEIMAEAALQMGSFRLSLGYLPLKFSGSSALDQPIVFGGETFTISDNVRSEMDVDLYDLGLTWYLVNFDDLPVRLQVGPEIAVKVIDGEASIASETTGEREEISGTVPVPTVGLRARVGLADFLAVNGRVGYIKYNDNAFLDADAQLEFSPIPLVGVFGGYRYLDLDVDEDELFIDARFSGPYAGAFVRF